MATLDVINLAKEKVGSIELADALVNANLDNADALFYEVVKAQLASRRSGGRTVKNRSLVSGGGSRSEITDAALADTGPLPRLIL